MLWVETVLVVREVEVTSDPSRDHRNLIWYPKQA